MNELKVLKALADANRLRITVLLVGRCLCFGHIEQALQLTQANTSKHLAVLIDAQIMSYYRHKQRKYVQLSTCFVEQYHHLYRFLGELASQEIYEADAKELITIDVCGCGAECRCKLEKKEEYHDEKDLGN